MVVKFNIMANECMTCIKENFPLEKGRLKSLVSNHGSLNHRLNAKFHTVIFTKHHVESLKGLTN